MVVVFWAHCLPHMIHITLTLWKSMHHTNSLLIPSDQRPFDFCCIYLSSHSEKYTNTFLTCGLHLIKDHAQLDRVGCLVKLYRVDSEPVKPVFTQNAKKKDV